MHSHPDLNVVFRGEEARAFVVRCPAPHILGGLRVGPEQLKVGASLAVVGEYEQLRHALDLPLAHSLLPSSRASCGYRLLRSCGRASRRLFRKAMARHCHGYQNQPAHAGHFVRMTACETCLE